MYLYLHSLLVEHKHPRTAVSHDDWPGVSFSLAWTTLISAWISNYIHYSVWDWITYPCHFTGHVLTYPLWDLQLVQVDNRGSWLLASFEKLMSHVDKWGYYVSLCVAKLGLLVASGFWDQGEFGKDVINKESQLNRHPVQKQPNTHWHNRRHIW